MDYNTGYLSVTDKCQHDMPYFFIWSSNEVTKLKTKANPVRRKVFAVISDNQFASWLLCIPFH